MTKNLRVIQVKGVIDSPQTQRDIMSFLGLKKVRQSAVHPDNPAARGQVHRVRHLVIVEGAD